MATAFGKQLKNKNFLSPVGFKFSLAKEPKIAFYCNSAKIPEISLSLTEQPTYLKTIDMPGGKITYGDLVLTFLVDEDMENYITIHKWLTGLGFPESTEQYKDLVTNEDNLQDEKRAFSDGSLYILDNNFNTNIIVKFKDLFPISLSALDFNATQTDVQYFTSEVTLRYTIFNILNKNGQPL
jgi:hypothetical protein